MGRLTWSSVTHHLAQFNEVLFQLIPTAIAVVIGGCLLLLLSIPVALCFVMPCAGSASVIREGDFMNCQPGTTLVLTPHEHYVLAECVCPRETP